MKEEKSTNNLINNESMTLMKNNKKIMKTID